MTPAHDILVTIREDVPHMLETLGKQWECRDPRLWQQHQELYLEFGKKAIALGQPILAFDILKEGRSYFPKSAELAYNAALALVRSGSTGHAADIVHPLQETLDQHSPLYTDVLSLAGRIAKERWVKAPAGPRKQMFGAQAATWYRRAYECSGQYFPGINAATMSMLTGQVDEGLQITRQVRDTCRALQKAASGNDYWLPATIGEACVLLGEQAEAVQCYREAVQRAGNNAGDVATMRRQVQLLAQYLEVDAAVLAVLRTGRVVVFSGHMIDTPERPVPRFPPSLEAEVRAAIVDQLDQLGAGYGYAAAACGSDMLFLECLLDRDAQAHVILPFSQEDFLRTSVAFAGAGWVERFHRVLSRATTVRYATEEGYLGDDILFDYNNALLSGTALLHANFLGAELAGLFVFDTSSASGDGGTRDALQAWQQTGRVPQAISLDGLRERGESRMARDHTTSAAAPPRPAGSMPGAQPRLGREIKTMLFADMVGFSKLSEASALSFIVHFWGEVAKVLEASVVQPAFKNTWGDGLFLVFEDATVGADFALRLRAVMQSTNWAAVGLPADTSIRIGMHAGPVLPGLDPIIKQKNFFGSHVNMAARIEPITPPGAVYVSEQFASLLMASRATAFACDYMGNLALAKSRGAVYPIYRLRRADELE